MVDRTPVAHSDYVVWNSGQLEFRMDTYLTDAMPPTNLTTSARCIVLHGNQALMITDKDNVFHVIPGGQIECGETPEVAVRRELLEETNLKVGNLHYIGFLHYRHQLPKPADLSYLYPDFYQIVYAAEVLPKQTPISEDSWVVDAKFIDMSDAQKLISKSEQLLLECAVHSIVRKS